MSARAVVIAGILIATAGATVVAAATLKSASIAGWTTYVLATEARIEHETAARDRFLADDFTADGAADRKAAQSGAVVIHKIETRDTQGHAIDIPDALVHHWRGLVFIPHATMDETVAWLWGGAVDTGQEDVLGSAVLERRPDGLRVSLKIQRSKIVTAVYNTEHIIRIVRYGATRAASTSTATRIAELVDPNTPRERELPPGEDRGFLWRWNAYWRYEQVDGGVLAECESVSLSRDLPPIVGLMVRPIVNSTARESMERTLAALRTRLTLRASQTPPGRSPAR